MTGMNRILPCGIVTSRVAFDRATPVGFHRPGKEPDARLLTDGGVLTGLVEARVLVLWDGEHPLPPPRGPLAVGRAVRRRVRRDDLRLRVCSSAPRAPGPDRRDEQHRARRTSCVGSLEPLRRPVAAAGPALEVPGGASAGDAQFARSRHALPGILSSSSRRISLRTDDGITRWGEPLLTRSGGEPARGCGPTSPFGDSDGVAGSATKRAGPPRGGPAPCGADTKSAADRASVSPGSGAADRRRRAGSAAPRRSAAWPRWSVRRRARSRCAPAPAPA